MSTYIGMTVNEVVVALFSLGIGVSATSYADQPAIEIDTGSAHYTVQICFLSPDCVLVKHPQMPGRDIVIKDNIIDEFFANEYSITSNLLTGPEFDVYKDAIEAGLSD